MKVSIAGTGYVGLVSGVCLAELGHDVTCVDMDTAKVDLINDGIPPIYEAGLEALLKANVGHRLRATGDLRTAVRDSELTLIAVGTPFKGDEIDLSYIRKVAAEIGEALQDKKTYHTVVVKSTVVPGTTECVVLPILEQHSGKTAGKDFGVGMNPEFLREGEAVADFMNPDRIVCGGVDQRSRETLKSLYDVFDGVDVLMTNCSTAETIKYTANSLLATLISFSNEIASLCESTAGVDVVEVMQGVHLDKRLSPFADDKHRVLPGILSYLAAGCGFGGSCFPKDVKALIAHGVARGLPMPLLQSVISINEQQPLRMVELLKKHFDSLSGKRIAVLGLAFKPGSDDIRESPALPIIRSLLRESAKVQAFDPVARHEAEKIFDKHTVSYRDDLTSVIKDADAILIVTRWHDFGELPELLRGKETQPVVIDGRRMLDPHSVARYEGIGVRAS